MNNTTASYSTTIKRACLEAGIKLYEFADACGIDRNRFYKLINGHAKANSYELQIINETIGNLKRTSKETT